MFQKLREKAHQIALVASVAAFSVAAHANTDPFMTAVSEVKTKIGEYGAALVGVAAVGILFSLAIKYIKKIVRTS